MVTIHDINTNVTIHKIRGGFFIRNVFQWKNYNTSNINPTAIAYTKIVARKNVITVTRGLEVNDKIFTAKPVTADNYLELFTKIYKDFDFWFDAVVNSTQHDGKTGFLTCKQDYLEYKQVAENVFNTYHITSKNHMIASLVYTSVNNQLIKTIIEKIEKTTPELQEKLIISKPGVSLIVSWPIHIGNQEWFLVKWEKNTGFNDGWFIYDEILWLAQAHTIITDMNMFIDCYANKNSNTINPDSDIITAVKNNWNTLGNSEDITVTIKS